jgi:hypothetical protein
VLVRIDLGVADQIVQVGHACMEAAWRYPAPPTPCFLVVLAVPSQMVLAATCDRLDAADIAYVAFYEPDHHHGLTALCTAPLAGQQRAFFRRYRLWQATAAQVRARAPPLCRQMLQWVAATRPGLKPPGCKQRRMHPAFHYRKPPHGGVVHSKGL